MDLVKRLARHVLRDELAELRWETLRESDRNQAAIYESLARVSRGGAGSSVTIKKVGSLEEWDEGRR